VHDVVVKKFTFAISSPDEFLVNTTHKVGLSPMTHDTCCSTCQGFRKLLSDKQTKHTDKQTESTKIINHTASRVVNKFESKNHCTLFPGTWTHTANDRSICKQLNVNKDWPISVQRFGNKLWRNRADSYSKFCCATCCKTTTKYDRRATFVARQSCATKVPQRKSRVSSALGSG